MPHKKRLIKVPQFGNSMTKYDKKNGQDRKICHFIKLFFSLPHINVSFNDDVMKSDVMLVSHFLLRGGKNKIMKQV